jgi:hypothetical protein
LGAKEQHEEARAAEAAAQAALAELPHHGETVLAWPSGEPVRDTTLNAAFKQTCTRAGEDHRLPLARSRQTATSA